MNSIKFAGIAFAIFGLIVVTSISWSVLIPHQELVLTEKYDFETMTKEQTFIGHNRPFLLSGTTLLWCNGSLKTFDSLGTVITTGVQLNDAEDEVTQCQ